MEKSIFNRFSKKTKEILIAAQKLAQTENRGVSDNYLFLALLLTPGTIAYDLLREFTVNPDQYRLITSLKQPQWTSFGITSNAKKILKNSFKVAIEYSHSEIEPEHILYAILDDSANGPNQILMQMGVDPEEIKSQIKFIFQDLKEMDNLINQQIDHLKNNPSPQPGLTDMYKKEEIDVLKYFAVDLTEKSKTGQIDPVIGREVEIQRIFQILLRRKKNNPILIGDPGVGKTAIVEELANRLAKDEVPDHLKGMKLISLDLGLLIAGTMYRGQFESRVKKLLSEIKKAGNVILFIDELHTTIGTGSAEGSLDTANMLKPILSRGEFKIIGATTYDEYKKYLEKDPAYERRFQVVQVNEPTPEETYKILRGLRSRYEEHHGVKFTPDALHAAVEFSHRYISDRYLPDKAIDLIDEAAAATNIVTSLGAKVAKLKSKLADMLAKKEDAVTAENYEAATQLREEEIKLTDRITALEGELIAGKEKVIDAADIARVVSRWTGVNVENLSLDERKRFLNLETRLKRYIIGQDEAVKAIAKSIRRSRAGVADPRRPIGSYLFLGPTGVGKTHLSKKLAEILFGSEDSLIKIDMSEFMEKHNVSRLVGAPAGYVGYDDGGKLTEAVRHKPYSIILFDEIEKAHPEVFNILLQILEDGYLTDAKGRRINFRNTIVILTSNLGTLELNKVAAIGFSANAGGKKDFEKKYESLKERVMEIVNKELRPEFINRLDSIIVFRPLDKTSVERIVELNLVELSKRLKKQGIILSVTKDVKKFIAETGFSEEFGARPIRRAISENLEDPISEAIIAGKYSSGDKISVHLVNGKIVFRK